MVKVTVARLKSGGAVLPHRYAPRSGALPSSGL